MSIKTYFQKRILQNENKKNSREKQLKNFAEIKSVLVLASLKFEKDWDVWERYFNNLSSHIKKVDIIAFVNEKKNKQDQENLPENLIFPHQINWFGNANDRLKLKAYEEFQYDVLIDLNFDDLFVLNQVFVKSKSTLKVCSDERKTHLQFCDLLLKTDSPNTKQKLYIDQVFYYLRQINSNGSS